jgi:transposase
MAAVDQGLPAYEAAKVFNVSVSYIYKALDRRRVSAEVSARPQKSHQSRKLACHHDALRAVIRERPDITLKELAAMLKIEHGVSAAIATVAHEVKLLGFTRKKSH